MKKMEDVLSNASIASQLPRRARTDRRIPKLSQSAREKINARRQARVEEKREGISVEGNLGHKSTIDLRKYFPISRRYPLRQTFSWFLALAGLWMLYYSLYEWDRSQPFSSVFNSMRVEEQAVLVAAFAVVAVKLAYQILFLWTFTYRTEGFRLVVERGIILKEVGSLPLLPIAEVYVRRNILDLIFGLYQVHIAVPIDASKSFAKIEGLSKRHAFALKNFLSQQLSRQVFIPPEASAEQEQADGYVE